MDETNYRSTYREINDLPCVYEKAILQQCCQCHRARHFNLAERIGVACTNTAEQKRCQVFLELMQQKSVFALQLPGQDGTDLPHAKKIKIQCGGIIGLQSLFPGTDPEKDVSALLDESLHRHKDLQSLPYEELVRSVVSFEGRRRKRPGKT